LLVAWRPRRSKQDVITFTFFHIIN